MRERAEDRTIDIRTIDNRLAGIERNEQARIAFAIESGGRARGFPSLDSDSDCRFVDLPRYDDSLSLVPARYVVETPSSEVLGVNGRHLAKAPRLLLAGNAVIAQWLTSPIVQPALEGFRMHSRNARDRSGGAPKDLVPRR